MAIGYRLDILRGLTLVVWDGDVTDDEVTAYLSRLAENVEWPPGPLHLTDITTAGHVAVPDPELVAELVADNRDTARLAILARDTQPVTRHLAGPGTPPGTSVAVFHDLAAACDWLGIDDTAARATLDAIRHDL